MDTKFFEMFKMMENLNMQSSPQNPYADEGFEKLMRVFELKNSLDNCESVIEVLFVVREYLPPTSQRSVDLLVKLMEVRELLEASRSTQFGNE